MVELGCARRALGGDDVSFVIYLGFFLEIPEYCDFGDPFGSQLETATGC